jgi:hypothetical protein
MRRPVGLLKPTPTLAVCESSAMHVCHRCHSRIIIEGRAIITPAFVPVLRSSKTKTMSYLAASTLGLSGYKSQMDATAHIKTAGSASDPKAKELTTKDALTWQERPSTPEEQKRWRQSTFHEPGKVTRHPGHANDAVPQGPFGIKSKEGESAANMMKQLPDSQVAQWSQARKEEIYASSTREPLGAGFVRGHKLPEGAGTTQPFGIVLGARELEVTGQVRQLMATGNQAEEDNEATRKLYVKSHGSYQPGEQRQRGYDWATTKVDPNDHRFGAVDKQGVRDGVKKALQPALDPSATEVKVVSKGESLFKSIDRNVCY